MKSINTILLIFAFTIIANAQVKIGDKLPLITLENNLGVVKKITLSNNKYVLIDFWASWCAPCRTGNKKLVRLHDTHNANIEIIGISIDTDKTKWKKAIEKDKIKFQQYIDPKGFDAPTAVKFGVEDIPSQYLFDKTGKLISINPSHEELLKLIK